MTHRDTVINSDGVKFLGDAASLTNRAGDQLTHVLQVHVTGHELGEGVRDSNNGLTEVVIAHAGGTPQGAGTSHVTAVS